MHHHFGYQAVIFDVLAYIAVTVFIVSGILYAIHEALDLWKTRQRKRQLALRIEFLRQEFQKGLFSVPAVLGDKTTKSLDCSGVGPVRPLTKKGKPPYDWNLDGM